MNNKIINPLGGRGATIKNSSNELMVINDNNSNSYMSKVTDAVSKVNPHWLDGPEWQNNCQRCAIAYELNRRGINVEAKPFLGNYDPIFTGMRWANAFKGQKLDGYIANWIGGNTAALGRTNKQVERAILHKMSQWGEGSRAEIYVVWKSSGAHVFNVEFHNGKIIGADGQSGRVFELGKILERSKPSKTSISRIDNLEMKKNIVNMAVKRK